MIKTLLATTALVLASSIAAVAQPTSFAVIHLDDVGRGVHLPRVEARLATATVYPRSFVNIPLCGPSRAAFLTGQSADTTGIVDNGEADWGTNFMPQALAAAGYRTMMIGKMPNGYTGTPAALGFQKWAVIEDIGSARYFGAKLNVNGKTIEPPGYIPDDLYQRILSCVTGSRPFFCWLAAIGSHAPALAAPRHVGACADVRFRPGPAFNEADKSDKPPWIRNLPLFDAAKETKVEQAWREQCDTIQADDEGIAAILDRLANNQNVCVIVTSDNGRMAGQHGLTGKGVLYEESIGVPLYTWNCGTQPGVDNRLVSNLDLPAHMYELSGVAPLRDLDGRPLNGARRNRVPIQGATGNGEVGYRWEDEVAWVFPNGWRERYNLVTDPHQERNLE